MIIVISFFLLGVVAQLLKAGVQFPKGLYQSLTLFLMIAIGLKGGVALAEHGDASLLPISLAVIAFGIVLALVAFFLLQLFGDLGRQNSASIAAHYGSVSVGTYAAAVTFLETQQISYEPYFPVFVVMLEIPAIAAATALLKRSQNEIDLKGLLHHVFCNQGVVLMAGGLFIGYIAAEETSTIMPFFKDLFHGVLAIFLLEMGMVAAKRLTELKHESGFISAFGVFMPLLGGIMGGALGAIFGFSLGGVFLMAVLGGSASYIAAPAAMRIVAPDANHGLSITAALGITFPFNLLVGLPIYSAWAHWIS